MKTSRLLPACSTPRARNGTEKVVVRLLGEYKAINTNTETHTHSLTHTHTHTHTHTLIHTQYTSQARTSSPLLHLPLVLNDRHTRPSKRLPSPGRDTLMHDPGPCAVGVWWCVDVVVLWNFYTVRGIRLRSGSDFVL
jgi:hypothetical protein